MDRYSESQEMAFEGGGRSTSLPRTVPLKMCWKGPPVYGALRLVVYICMQDFFCTQHNVPNSGQIVHSYKWWSLMEKSLPQTNQRQTARSEWKKLLWIEYVMPKFFKTVRMSLDTSAETLPRAKKFILMEKLRCLVGCKRILMVCRSSCKYCWSFRISKHS